MAKYYFISCKEVGYPDCDYSSRGETIEEVIDRVAEHGRDMHDLKGFGVELYRRMRPHIHLREDPERAAP